MSKNTACSNNKCPMYKNGFSANNRTCMNCIYKVNINQTENSFSTNNTNMSNNHLDKTDIHLKDAPNSFKSTNENISNMTYNYSETIASNIAYSNQGSLGDFYKVKKHTRLFTKLLLFVIVVLLLAISYFIVKPLI